MITNLTIWTGTLIKLENRKTIHTHKKENADKIKTGDGKQKRMDSAVWVERVKLVYIYRIQRGGPHH
jgi:hypothetical protein